VTAVAVTRLADGREVSAVDGGALRPLGCVSELGEVVNRILDLEPLLASPGSDAISQQGGGTHGVPG
jgi:hypothetical protein